MQHLLFYRRGTFSLFLFNIHIKLETNFAKILQKHLPVNKSRWAGCRCVAFIFSKTFKDFQVKKPTNGKQMEALPVLACKGHHITK